jgi:hypothetical protein
MGTLSIRKDPHPTFRQPWSPDASSYRYCGCFTQSGSPPSFLPGHLLSESLRFLSSGSPFLKLLLVSAYSCGICFLQAGRVSAVFLADSCFHLSFSQNGPFISYLMGQIYYRRNTKAIFKAVYYKQLIHQSY